MKVEHRIKIYKQIEHFKLTYKELMKAEQRHELASKQLDELMLEPYSDCQAQKEQVSE